MADPRDQIPAYRTIRLTAPPAPEAERADTQAWQARGAYPQIRFAGAPAFGVARERDEGGWQLHPWFGVLTPQEARDTMAPHFREQAQHAEQARDQKAARAWRAAADRMDREAVNEVTVRGTRFRVVRADRFLRTGPLGPEPPRPADPDPGEVGDASHAPDPAAGFVIDTITATGPSEGILKLELLAAIRKRGTVPDDVREDSLRASRSHPGGVLLPAAFVPAELTRGEWGPVHLETSPTPQGARDDLAVHLRITVPWKQDLDPDARAVYAAAADQLDAGRLDDLTVAGHPFRIVRVERLVRVGPDGPEGPRPSDFDPQLPVLAEDQPSADSPADDQDENTPLELDDNARRFLQLFHEEEARRQTRHQQR